MAFRLLACLARAIVKNGAKLVCAVLPGGSALADVAADAWEDYRKEQREDALRAEVQALAQAPAEQVRQEVGAAVAAEAAAAPAEVQQALTAYLTQVPAAIRRSLRRPSDPTGTTVPANLALACPEDLERFLPPRPPRFKPGDRPLPGVDWVLEELVGVGGFGEVWKARHAHLRSQGPVALKFCLDASAAPALRNEAGVLDRVMEHGRHPGIVPLLHTYLSADPPCLEYEFVEGGDLAGLIGELHAQGGLTPEAANALLLRLAEVIAHAHGHGIVHGDLKPANILVRRGADGKVALRVTDFGIGGLAAAQAARETRQPTRSRQELLTEAVRGAYTPLYASPEQMIRRKGEPADPRDDVHALGVIWYQLLTGDLGLMSVPSDWREQVEERGLEAELVRLLASCIAPRAEKRPGSAAVLAERLRAGQPAPAAVADAPPSPPSPPTALGGAGGAPPVAHAPGSPRREAPDDLAAQLASALRAVEQAHAEARRLAERQHDYAAAEQELARVPEHLRDKALLASLTERRDRAAQLDQEVRQAVREMRLVGLRPKVAALLELQPQREDLRRLLERLPKERQAGEVVAVSLGGGIDLRFAWCPPGTFLMGSPPSEQERSDDETQHRVTLTKGFWLAVTAVTQAQWQAVMGSNPSHFKGDDRPVEQVSWDDCQDFCRKLAERTGKTFRLPSEAEWEYACRAGTTTPFHNGCTLSTEQANYDGNHTYGPGKKGVYRHQTTPVGSFPANAWGLFEMHGNVYEWCADWYGPYQTGDVKDPKGRNYGTTRVLRGGSWGYHPGFCRSAYRCWNAPGSRNNSIGCRLVVCLD
jgi:formylglycine-generating enzyme required for sulfatase activity/serine/threonine protein kinase